MRMNREMAAEYVESLFKNCDCDRCLFGASGDCHLQCNNMDEMIEDMIGAYVDEW